MTERNVWAVIEDLKRRARTRRRPDKWRAKFRRTIGAAIQALEEASPLTERDTSVAIRLLMMAREAYAPERKPRSVTADYQSALRRAQALAGAGRSAAQIVATLTAEKACSERTAWRYARKARRS